MIGTFSEDESVAWPSYVDFLSTFAILMILFAGYMAFLLSNGVRDTEFLSDVESTAPVAGVSVDADRRQIQVNLSDVISYMTGCPGRKTPPRKEDIHKQETCEIDNAGRKKLQEIAVKIAQAYPHASRISVQGRADTQPGSSDYTNMEVAGRRAMQVFETLNECKACSEEFHRKLEIANVGDKRALGVGPEFRTVFLILEYAQDEQE